MSNKTSIELPEAIILCGGKGERLRPFTNDTPKPLVKIDENNSNEILDNMNFANK